MATFRAKKQGIQTFDTDNRIFQTSSKTIKFGATAIFIKKDKEKLREQIIFTLPLMMAVVLSLLS
ncbi:hypothetical protein GNF10_05135 [Nostoc sp. UCD121]|uniref:hypothetical protein n=1 Tax=unclassified Nostoc TaxID=2593658 RepID=UPI001623F367|nr:MULTISPECIES: hypothetical protein [unclassified Nostoc]MBC1222071.1 hypothetical protein [Nostoc sp. UCD120]MBC1275379.1 hypothetical protein [Nostoc sp. UCD121]MBC1293533.1 hypothetical protein [Nostoc sp. UCD122]